MRYLAMIYLIDQVILVIVGDRIDLIEASRRDNSAGSKRQKIATLFSTFQNVEQNFQEIEPLWSSN